MIKKRITYTDYNGVTRTEDFYFNMTEAELTGLYTSVKGGMQALLRQISQTQDMPRLMELFREIIRLSYGEKSPDGRQFMKSQEIFERFSQTEAYSELFMELISDSKKAADFARGILPKKMAEEAQKRNEELLNAEIPSEYIQNLVEDNTPML